MCVCVWIYFHTRMFFMCARAVSIFTHVHRYRYRFSYTRTHSLTHTHTWQVFLIGTSFVHYCRYIATYYYRHNVAYGNFKRDAVIYKSVALAQLLGLYLLSIKSLAAVPLVEWCMVLGGWGLSTYTAHQLGVDGTYFGIELGFVKAQKNYVQKFPYGVIPHPMILSQCIAMLGLYRNAAFRAAWPYLVPAHICFYVAHMLQEEFDIYKAPAAKPSRVEKFA